MELEDKLGKSLDDLIKEQTSTGRTGSRGVRDGRGRGRGGRAGRGGRGFKRGGEDDAMEIDGDSQERGRHKIDTSVLKPRGGISKGSGASGRDRRSRDAQQAERDVVLPHRNVNAKWVHDMHADDGPAAPRVMAASRRPGSRPQQHAEVLRRLVITNLGDVTHDDMIELFNYIAPANHVEMRPRGAGHICIADFPSERDAAKVYEAYKDASLDGQQIHIERRGVTAGTGVLSSGIVITKPARGRQQGLQQGGGGGRPRGRGTTGVFQSDGNAMYTD